MTVYQKLLEDMSKHAAGEYPKECCGIITKDFEYVPCKNISPKPKESFVLDPVALLDYEDTCWGIFHSHPGDENPLPSEDDKKGAAFDEYKFIVGFGNKYYLYWLDRNIDAVRFDDFKEEHLI